MNSHRPPFRLFAATSWRVRLSIKSLPTNSKVGEHELIRRSLRLEDGPGPITRPNELLRGSSDYHQHVMARLFCFSFRFPLGLEVLEALSELRTKAAAQLKSLVSSHAQLAKVGNAVFLGPIPPLRH